MEEGLEKISKLVSRVASNSYLKFDFHNIYNNFIDCKASIKFSSSHLIFDLLC